MQMHTVQRIRLRGCPRSKWPLGERDARADLVDIRGGQGLSAQPYNNLTTTLHQSVDDVFFRSQS